MAAIIDLCGDIYLRWVDAYSDVYPSRNFNLTEGGYMLETIDDAVLMTKDNMVEVGRLIVELLKEEGNIDDLNKILVLVGVEMKKE